MTDLSAEAIAAIEKLVRASTARTLDLPLPAAGMTTVAVVPDGMSIESLENVLKHARLSPERETGFHKLRDIRSMIDFGHMYVRKGSVLFGDWGSGDLRLIINFHAPFERVGDGKDALTHSGAPEMGGTAYPQYGDFGAVVRLAPSDEFTAWRQINDKPLSHKEFGAFIEKQILDIREGTVDDPRINRELAITGLQLASVSEVYAFARAAKITINDVHAGARTEQELEEAVKRKMETDQRFPAAFLLGIPVFEGDEPYAVLIRMRMEMQAGNPVFIMQMRHDKALIKDAFRLAAERLSTELAVPFLAAVGA